MEKTGLAAVVTGEVPSLNEAPWLPPTSMLGKLKALLSMRRGNWNPNSTVAKEYEID